MQQNGMSGRLNLPIVTEPFSALDMVLFPGLERSVVALLLECLGPAAGPKWPLKFDEWLNKRTLFFRKEFQV